MIVRSRSPVNAEPPASALAEDDITATNAFYCRNHGPIPDIAAKRWRLRVDGAVARPLELTYHELTTRFPAHDVVATLACAGNRRAELLKVRPIPGKDPWAQGAISTAAWRGARLADILRAAGVTPADGLHVAFDAPDVAQEACPVQTYGSSIPLGKALSGDVLLAWQMNGEPLPRLHGGPVRVVVPGFIGARSVKWVIGITVQPCESRNYFQAVDYRLLPADPDPGEAGIALSSLALSCGILVPDDGATVPAGPLSVRGYAIADDSRRVARVEVSVDGGASWRPAALRPGRSRWAWRPWTCTVAAQPGPLRVVARAWDDTGATHPESPAALWNPGGYANNSWPRVDVTVR
ncbi:sulfite oxidase [Mycobacterium talmoniae]|uniref:Sulfite oxidase n=1 Tax=Mycobacterium talmoniae TaxID=1858794 RepID=A0A1S1NC76_9MYCO|nr:sulfite oxidase [Mycobacterium eburneum]OHV02516.1 sulfite oxidase [Mycobacterium talmoniae]TDH56055.1 sulfite oxidase [Mycobacterium eburneum]